MKPKSNPYLRTSTRTNSRLTHASGFGLAICVAGLLPFGSPSAQAANITWVGNTDVNWATAGNWTPSAFTSGDSMFFGAAGSAGAALKNDLSSLTIAGITFNSGAAAFTISGNSFTLSGSIINNSTSTQRITNAIALSATQTINANTGTINLGGVISGTGFGLTKTGTGLLNLTGANTYTGTTTISAGTVGIVADTGLGATAAALSLDGGTLKVAGGTTNPVINTHALSVTTNGGTINNVGFAYSLAATLSGANTLNLTGATPGSLGYGGNIINGLGNYGTFLVNGTNSFTGTLNVGSGANIEYASATALSAATLNVNNGGRLSASTAITVANNIAVASGGSLAFQNANTGVFGGTITLSSGTANVHMFDWYNYATARSGSITGKITGSGGLNVFGVSGGTLTASGANDYTGATTLTNVGLTLNGATGTIASSSGSTLNNSTITADYTTANVNKLKDTGNVTLGQNSTLIITANTAANTTETMGTLGFTGGANTVTIGTAASRVTTLAASGLSRTNNSTALIRGSSLSQSVATNVSRLTLTTAPSGADFVGTNTLNSGGIADTTQALKIVPWLFGDTSISGTGSNFLTYDTTLGLRVLLTGEQTTLVAGSTTAAQPINAIAFNGTVTTAGLTVNSLLFSTTAQTLTGSGALTINSGAVASTVAAATIGSGFSSLALGNGEGVFHITTGTTTISTPISVTSSGGLTKTGGGTLTFGAANTYTGTTTVNQGTLTASVNNVFNGTTGTALVLGNNATVNIGATTQTVSSISLAGSGETVSGASGTLNLAGNITFDATVNENAAGTISVSTLNLNSTRTATVGDSLGTLTVSTTNLSAPDLIISSIIANGSGTSGLTKEGAGTLALSGANTFTGTTTINNGTLLIGNNGTVGTLAAAGSIVNNGTLGFSYGSTTITQGTGFSSSAISGTGGITNFGAGTTVLNAANSFSGAVNILNGVLSVNTVGNSGSNSALGTNGQINLGAVGNGAAAVTATLAYTGTGETTNKVIYLAGFGSAATSIIDASGSGLLKFTSALSGNDGSKTLTLQGTGTGEMAGALNDFTTGILSVTKSGAGTWTLSGANTFTGALAFGANSSGSIVLANTTAATTASQISFGAFIGNTLSLATDGGDTTALFNAGTGFAATIVADRATAGAGVTHNIGGTSALGGGTLTFTQGANVTSGLDTIAFNAVSLTAGSVQTTSFAANGANVTIGSVTIGLNNQLKTLGLDGTATGNAVTGIISNGAGTVAVSKAGAGTWTLSGANTYTGITTIGAGILSVNTLANGGAASAIGQSTNAATNLVFDGGTLQYTGANVTSDRAFTINATKTATINTTNNLTLVGATGTATNGALTKAGAGTLTLTGTNTYTGATQINAGNLKITGSLAAGSALGVNAGGTLSGTGSVGGLVTLAAGSGAASTRGTIDLTNLATNDTLTLGGGLTLGGTAGNFSSLIFETGSATSDKLAVTGALTVNVGGGTIAITDLGLAANTTYDLMSFSGAGTSNGSAFTVGSGTTINGFTLNNAGSLSFGVTGVLNVTAASGGILQLVTSGTASPTTAYWIGTQGGSGGTIASQWNGYNGADGNFTTDAAGTSFAQAYPSGTTDVFFAATGAANLTNTLGKDFSIKSLTFLAQDDALTTIGAVNISGGNALIIGAGGITNANTNGVTLGMTTLTPGTSQTWANNSAAALNISSAVTGNAASGTTTLTLSNISTGSTTISGVIGNGSVGGNLALTVNNSGAGVTTLSNTNTFSGGTTLNRGTVTSAATGGYGTGFVTVDPTGTAGNSTDAATLNTNGSIASTAAVTVNSNSATAIGTINFNSTAPTIGSLSGTGNAVLNNAAGTNLTIGSTNNLSSTFSGVISNGAGTGSITKAGSGTLTLSGANTYSGSTTISAGTLQISAANNLGDGSASNTISLGAGSLQSTANTYDLGSTRSIGMIGNGAIQADAGTLTVSGGISASTAGTKILTVQGAGNTTVSGAITAGSGAMNLVKLGTGTLTLSGGGVFGTAGITAYGGTNSAVLLGGTTRISSGTYTSAGEFVVGGMLTAGGAGVNTNLTMDGGGLTISNYLSLGRGNGVGAVSSDIVLNNSAAISASNFSAGYNNANASNTPAGTFTLNNSSTFGDSGAFNLAENVGSNMTMTLNGSSTLTSTSTANNSQYVGNSGTGVLNINGTSTANFAADLHLGAAATGNGRVNLIGGTLNFGTAALKWFYVGDAGAGRVDINSGTWKLENSSSIKFSNNAAAVTNVINQNGGSVSFFSDAGTTIGGTGALDMQLSGTTTTSSTYNLNGGTLTVPQIIATTTTGTRIFNFNGGTLKAATTGGTLMTATAASRANVRDGGAIIDTNGNNVTIAQALLHSNVATVNPNTLAVDAAKDGGLTKNGAGVLTLTALNTFTGDVTLTNDSIAAGIDIGGTFTNSALGNLDDGLATARNINVGSGTTLSITAGNSFGTGGSANTLSRIALNITGGTFQTGTNAAGAGFWNKIGAVNLNGGTVSVGSGASNTNFQGLALIGTVTVSGSSASTINNLGSSDAGFNAIHLGQNATTGQMITFDVADVTGDSTSDLNVSAKLINTSANLVASGLIKSGVGTMTLTATNGYTGGTMITGGALALAHATDTLSNAGAVTVNGGTLAIGSNSDTVGAVTLTSGSITGTTGVLTGSSYATTNGTVSAILGGTGVLNQSGSGTTTLTGINTYTGATTINSGGTLALGSTGSIASSSVITANGTLDVSAQSGMTIGATQTLKGSGTVTVGTSGNLAIAGTMAAGNSPGVLAVSNGSGGTGSTSFSSGSIFSWDLDTTLSGRGTAYDGVNTSAVAGTDAIFQVVLQGTESFSDAFWTTTHTWSDIFTTDGSTPVSSDLATVFSSFTYANGSGVLSTPSSSIGSFTLTGSTLSWSAVPEPTSALAGLLLGAGLLRRRRSSVAVSR